MANIHDEMDRAALTCINNLATDSMNTSAEDSWYCIASCTFAAANQGKYVADVYRKAIAKYSSTDYNQHRRILRRIKESLTKTSIIYGIPRVINAFRALIQALPSLESNEVDSIRLHIERPADTDERGFEYMRNIFRDDMDPSLETMEKFWPDLRTLVVTFIYGYYQSDVSIIDAVTTSQLNIAKLIPMNVTTEVAWHMRGLIRNGGSEEQLRFALETTLSICKVADVRLSEVPDPEKVINEARLF